MSIELIYFIAGVIVGIIIAVYYGKFRREWGKKITESLSTDSNVFKTAMSITSQMKIGKEKDGEK